MLLATQIALCTVLLAGAGLVTRAIAHAMSFDPGFQVQGVDVVSAALPSGVSIKERESLVQQTMAQIADGVETVAVADIGPFDDSRLVMYMGLPHKSAAEFEAVLLRPVSSRYFDVLGIPVLRGSMFEPNTTNEAVVNEAFVRAYWPGENVVGQTARDVDRAGGVRRSYTIVGVVRDTYLTGL